MLDLDTELGSLVKEELQRGFYAQAVNARARQLRIAQANARLEHAHIEGVGQHVASIDAFAFIDWERRNPGITRTRDWWKSLLRDNPECRVQSTSSKTQVSFAGLSAPGTDQETKRPRDQEPPVGTAGPAVRPLASSLEPQASGSRHSSLVTSHSEEAA